MFVWSKSQSNAEHNIFDDDDIDDADDTGADIDDIGNDDDHNDSTVAAEIGEECQVRLISVNSFADISCYIMLTFIIIGVWGRGAGVATRLNQPGGRPMDGHF